MKLKLLQLLNAQEALKALGDTKGLSSVVAYRISKNIKAVNEELKNYDETYKRLCEERAKKDDEGKPIIKDNKYSLSDDDLKEITEELNKLVNEEIDIDIKKVKLESIDKAGLSPFQIELVEFMLDLEENKEEE